MHIDNIDILGTKYDLIVDETGSENPKLVNADGYIERFSKKLVISQFETNKETAEKIESYANEILRHEIIHAFLFESGNVCYGNDERLVNILAVLLPKIYHACNFAESRIEGKSILNK